jgi:hypothetical protein
LKIRFLGSCSSSAWAHKPKDTADLYSHVTPMMIDALLTALQRRWEQYGTGAWCAHRRTTS